MDIDATQALDDTDIPEDEEDNEKKVVCISRFVSLKMNLIFYI